MKENEVEIEWSNWIDWDNENDPEWDFKRVSYMYANDNEPIYIGKAYKQTVKERFKGNEDREVIEWIEREYPGGFRVKVGHIILPEDTNITSQKLEDIHTLIIYIEYNDRGFCCGNILNTKTRPNYRPDMIVKNTGYYQPLLQTYYDIPSNFFQ